MNRALIGMLVLSAACTKDATSSRGNTPARDFATRDSAGVTIVESAAPRWTDATRWRIDSLPLTVIGANDNDLQQQFRFIRAALRLSNGTVLIAAENELRLFGADGKFLRTMARKGSGPGEFQSLGDVWRLDGDSVLASQFMAEGGMKDVLFKPDGSLSGEQRPDDNKLRALGHWGECHNMVLPDRSRILCQSDATIPVSASNRPSKITAPGWTSPGSGLLRQLRRLYLVPPSLDTAVALGISGGIEQFGVTINGKDLGFITHPFHGRSILAAGGSPLRIVSMTNPEYRLEVWTPQGKLERIILRSNGRRAPSTQEIDDATAEVQRLAQMRQRDPVIAAQLAAAVPTPDSLPAARGMVVGRAGEIFVLRDGFLPSHTATSYDVFSSAGEWLGTLTFPRRTLIAECGADYITTIHYDDNDVPRAEVFRLHK